MKRQPTTPELALSIITAAARLRHFAHNGYESDELRATLSAIDNELWQQIDYIEETTK